MASYLPKPQGNENEKRTSLYPSYINKYNKQRDEINKKKKLNSYEKDIPDIEFNEEPEILDKYNSDLEKLENEVNEYSKDDNNNLPYEKTTQKVITIKSVEKMLSNGEKKKVEESKEEVLEHISYGDNKKELNDSSNIDGFPKIENSNMLHLSKENKLNLNNYGNQLKVLNNTNEQSSNVPNNTYIVNNYYDRWNDLVDSTESIQLKIKNKFLIGGISIFAIIASICLLSIIFSNKENNNVNNQANGNVVQEIIYTPANTREALDFVHSLANSLIIADDGNTKWGRREVNPQNIRIAKESVKNFINDENLLNMLSEWEKGNFDNSVEVHNYVWDMLDGTVGYATDLDTMYIDSIIKTYFNK